MNGTDTPNADMLAEHLPDEELLRADGFDEALVGYAEVWTSEGQQRVLAYDRDKCLDVLMSQPSNMGWDEANEYFDFNVAGAYVGDKTPVFISRVTEE